EKLSHVSHDIPSRSQASTGEGTHEPLASRGEQRRYARLRIAAGDVDRRLAVDVDIDLAAHAELRQVDAWLNREASPRQDTAFLARPEVVHVGPVAVRLLSDRVAGTMHEVRPVPHLVDDVPGRIVHLPTLQRLLRGEGALDAVDAGVASPPHDLEDLLVARRH